MGALHTLSQRVEAAGIPCIVRSQFTLDPTEELLMLADALFADVLIVAIGDEDDRRRRLDRLAGVGGDRLRCC